MNQIIVTFALTYFSMIIHAEDAEALFGTAAIIGAASPMVMAGIQAAADRDIARINSQTSIATTQIGANTSMYLAQLQAQTSFSQIQATTSINALNQYSVTDRMRLQLDELSGARRDNLLMEREKLSMEWQLNQQRIGLAYKQSDDNALLGRLALSAQLVQSGLAPATSTSLQTPLAISRVFDARKISTIPQSNVYAFRASRNRMSVKIPVEVSGSLSAATTRPIRAVPSTQRALAGDWAPRRGLAKTIGSEESDQSRSTHNR